MGLFSRKQAGAPPAGDTQVSHATEAIVSDLAGRIRSVDPSTAGRADQVRELPGGKEMVAEAVRRAASGHLS